MAIRLAGELPPIDQSILHVQAQEESEHPQKPSYFFSGSTFAVAITKIDHNLFMLKQSLMIELPTKQELD